jgi:short subunit dehydrogenase-like uncharacterized protein
MSESRWMLYGATGYTGQIVAEEAVRRGHSPILAGRSEEKLRPLARKLGLKYVAFDLDDVNTIAKHTAQVELVYHAAGPFTYTSDPMIRACLATHTHYLDITGEIHVFENTFKYDETARKNGIALISGVGFDVIPSDSLAGYVAQQLPNAHTLDIGIQALSSVTVGTTKSLLEMLPKGGQLRRNGVLTYQRIGAGGRMIHFSSGEHRTIPIPWGDLSTAYRTTAIPNITTYMALDSASLFAINILSPFTGMLANNTFRGLMGKLVERVVQGPSPTVREVAKSHLWACATDTLGNKVQAWLETAEGYQFTMLAAIPTIERTLQLRPIGALTPVQAFGTDFVLEIEGTTRLDNLS